MAKTFSDFAFECMNYSHSQEHYEIMKESAELNLMAQYIENQEFMAEHTAYAESCEGFFTESAEEEQKEAVKESFGAKAKKLLKKIGNGFKQILATIIKFFKGIAAKFTASKEVKEIYNALVAAKYNGEALKELGGELKKAADNAKLSVRDGQPFKKIDKIGYINEEYIPYFQVALSWDKVIIGKYNSNVVNGEDLATIIERWADAKKGYEYAAVEKMIEKATTDVNAKGVIINADPDSIDKIVKRLTECQSKFEAFANTQYNIDDEAAGVINVMNDSLDIIRGVIGATMTQYGAFVAYRTESAKIIKKFMIDHKKVA